MFYKTVKLNNIKIAKHSLSMWILQSLCGTHNSAILRQHQRGGVGKVEQFEDDVLKVKFLEGRRRKNFQKFRSLLQTWRNVDEALDEIHSCKETNIKLKCFIK